MKIIHIGNVYL